MAGFINTVDVVDADVLMDSIITKTITEYKDDQIETVGEKVFAYCKNLVEVDLPNVTNAVGNNGETAGVYTAHEGVFAECTSLKKANIPLLENIGSYYYPGFFEGCSSLEKLDFKNAKRTGRNTFAGCTSLKTLILRKTDAICIAQGAVFYNTPIANGTGYIYVPRALLSDTDETKDYRRATNWATYAEQFRALEDFTVDGTTTGELDETKIAA